jgi:hypothetical protein
MTQQPAVKKTDSQIGKHSDTGIQEMGTEKMFATSAC